MIKGKISEILPELNSGFISCKGSEDIFFSPKTEFMGIAFAGLKVDQVVHFEAIETERGLFAKIIQPAVVASSNRSPEASA
jgi:cold shock CspA family protein